MSRSGSARLTLLPAIKAGRPLIHSRECIVLNLTVKGHLPSSAYNPLAIKLLRVMDGQRKSEQLSAWGQLTSLASVIIIAVVSFGIGYESGCGSPRSVGLCRRSIGGQRAP